MKWYYLIFVVVAGMLLRLILNAYKLFRVKNLYSKYHLYLSNNNLDFVQYKQEIISLFKEAGLQDSSVLHQEFLGFGKFANMRLSVFDNVTNTREDVVSIIQLKFNEAIGVYRKKRNESVNPIFWIEFIFKLPQYFMEFFGVLPEKLSVKILLVIYWITAIIFGLKKFDILDQLIK